MEIKFDVFFTKNLGTLYKDNSIDLDGIDVEVDLDLNKVNYILVNFEVGSNSYTDTVVIKDIDNKIVQIPFKTDVLKQGLNQFELVATMKNGDVKPSQSCKYNIIKSLENPNSVQADTNYPILIDLINRVSNTSESGGTGGTIEGHTHANKTTLDKITEEKLTSWDNKLNSIPSEYVTDTELNNKGYLTQHQDISGKVDKVTGKSLIADTEITRLATIVNYTLPIATASTLGGIKVGAGLSITSGVLSTTGGGIADSVEWSNIQNKPSVFTPSEHTHTKTDVTDFSHGHTKTDITDFTHTHTITDLPTGTTSTTVALGNHTHSGVYEPVITKNTAFNVNFDTTATNIKMNGTQSLGSLSTVARADHVHPTDTTKVPTTRTINNKALSSDITLTLDDVANGSTRSLDNYSPTTHNHDTNYSPLSHASDSAVHITSSERTSWNAKSNFDGNYNNLTNKPTIPTVTNDLTSALKTNYDTAYTHSQSNHAPSTAQKNSDITKAEIEAKLTGAISSHSHSSSLVITNIVGTTLTLTTDKYQTTTMVTGTTIVLPTVTSFTEIHLFFSASSDMTLTLPSCKWQSTPTISSGKYYEFIFTYVTEWIGGCIIYG